MEKMKQGNTYNEEPVEVMEGASPKIPKGVFIGLAIVILVTVVFVAMYILKPKENTDSTETTEVIMEFSYTAEELDQLRSAGYTGKEIEDYQLSMIESAILVQSAKEKQEAFLKETYAELNNAVSNTASQEYKDLIAKTWLGGEVTQVQPAEGSDEYTYEVFSRKENVDYIKLPPRGQQLFLRLKVPNTEVFFFMPVHPQRYYQLEESGNIVITYDEVIFGGKTFITNVFEVVL